MNRPTPQEVGEAVAVVNAAVALAGGEVHPIARDLIEAMGRGEISGDRAAQAIIAEFVEAPSA
ncbi:hypothetical protein [Mycolicibacterium chlorophenolicum]|nr:hypothetical protein [Mycolicibacterium chlorophenolicum]